MSTRVGHHLVGNSGGIAQKVPPIHRILPPPEFTRVRSPTMREAGAAVLDAAVRASPTQARGTLFGRCQLAATACIPQTPQEETSSQSRPGEFLRRGRFSDSSAKSFGIVYPQIRHRSRGQRVVLAGKGIVPASQLPWHRHGHRSCSGLNHNRSVDAGPRTVHTALRANLDAANRLSDGTNRTRHVRPAPTRSQLGPPSEAQRKLPKLGRSRRQINPAAKNRPGASRSANYTRQHR